MLHLLLHSSPEDVSGTIVEQQTYTCFYPSILCIHCSKAFNQFNQSIVKCTQLFVRHRKSVELSRVLFLESLSSKVFWRVTDQINTSSAPKQKTKEPQKISCASLLDVSHLKHYLRFLPYGLTSCFDLP